MKGVLVVVQFPDGSHVGNATDFNSSVPAGFGVREMQERRAREAAWSDAFRNTCHPHIAEGIWRRQAVLDSLRTQLKSMGWKELVIPIGYEDDE